MISIKDNKIRWAISAVLALLILFGTYRNVFSLAAFLIMGLMLVFCDKESNLMQIFFVMPMANIFKLSPGVQSFFTIVILVYVVLHLVLPRRATLVVMIFAVYVLIGQLFAGGFNLFRTIKLICSLLFLSSILNKEVKIQNKEIFLSYIIGNIIASLFGLIDTGIFKIESYVGTSELGGLVNNEDDIFRFKGLYSDPNYYSVCIIVSLCLVLALYHREEINAFFSAIMAGPMLYFLIITYSKSAMLMLILFCAFFLYSLILKKKHFPFIVTILLLVAVAVLALSGQIPIFDTIIERFLAASEGEEVDVNKLTTGRVGLWIMYLRYIIQNLGTAIFGDGISANLYNGMAAHNTYIDILRHLGVVGGTLLLVSLKMILSQSVREINRRNLLNYSVLICVFLMYFFLSELFYVDAPFHLFFAFTLIYLPMDKRNSKNI